MNPANRVLATIRTHGMISPGDSVLLGVSGGPDSVALLHILNGLKGRLGCTLAVAHFDHGLRGREGREDAAFVRQMADALDLPCHLGQQAAGGRGGRPCLGGGNVEAHARESRYRFFGEVAARAGATTVAVGHNRDDQVETMLMWMLRGCGPSALGGMPPVRVLFHEDSGKSQPTLVRPLIDLPRTEIIQYLRAQGLTYRQDATNRDTRYLRNWVRSDLLPALVERTDDGLKARLARLSGLLQSDQLLLDRYVAEASASAIEDGVLSCPAFLRLEAHLRSRVLRSWLRSYLGDLRGVGFEHVESMMRLTVSDRPSGYVSLPGGWTVVKDYDRMHLARGLEDQPPSTYDYALPLEGEVRIAELGVTVRAWCSKPAEALPPENMHRAIFDRDALNGTRRLRSRRPGDRFQPLGMAGHKKVKDLLIEKKAPRRLRDRLPLVLVGGEVLWVPGYGRSGAATVDSSTREVWNLEMSAIDSRRTGSY